MCLARRSVVGVKRRFSDSICGEDLLVACLSSQCLPRLQRTWAQTCSVFLGFWGMSLDRSEWKCDLCPDFAN